MAKECARRMIARGKGGKIVSTASTASIFALHDHAPYCTSKAAINGLTKVSHLFTWRYRCLKHVVRLLKPPMNLSVFTSLRFSELWSPRSLISIMKCWRLIRDSEHWGHGDTFSRISHLSYSPSFWMVLTVCVVQFPAAPLEQVMAAEWSKYDIQCNTIGPTIVLTDMGAKAWGWVTVSNVHIKLTNVLLNVFMIKRATVTLFCWTLPFTRLSHLDCSLATWCYTSLIFLRATHGYCPFDSFITPPGDFASTGSRRRETRCSTAHHWGALRNPGRWLTV